jgi:hypothetical protein
MSSTRFHYVVTVRMNIFTPHMWGCCALWGHTQANLRCYNAEEAAWLRVFLYPARGRGFEITPVSLDNMASLDDKQQKSFLPLVVCLALRLLRRLLFKRVVHFADRHISLWIQWPAWINIRSSGYELSRSDVTAVFRRMFMLEGIKRVVQSFL